MKNKMISDQIIQERTSASIKMLVSDKKGLHTSPSSLIVAAINQMIENKIVDEIWIKCNDRVADARFVLNLLYLEAAEGSEIEIFVKGDRVELAIKIIEQILSFILEHDDPMDIKIPTVLSMVPR